MSAYDLLYQQLMPTRPKDAHKALFGHVLIVGGGPGMPGAVALSANAALRVGAGMVSVATWPDYARQPLPGLPEAMIHAVHDVQCLDSLLSKSTACILGPGLGEDDWARQCYSKIIATTKPLVMDASALRLLADTTGNHPAQGLRKNWVLTPHPGEAAALLHCSTHDIQKNRQAAAECIQQQYGGIVVLKGSGSLVLDCEQHVFLCEAGNPGMATAGMGDVLSGVIGGLIAQGLSPGDSARLGVWLHATAGDYAAKERGERGLIASDLMSFLHQLSNPVKAS